MPTTLHTHTHKQQTQIRLSHLDCPHLPRPKEKINSPIIIPDILGRLSTLRVQAAPGSTLTDGATRISSNLLLAGPPWATTQRRSHASQSSTRRISLKPAAPQYRILDAQCELALAGFHSFWLLPCAKSDRGRGAAQRDLAVNSHVSLAYELSVKLSCLFRTDGIVPVGLSRDAAPRMALVVVEDGREEP